MRDRVFRYAGLYALLVFLVSACATGQKQYEIAMQLNQAGNYKEALAYMEQAVASNPSNEEYKRALAGLKQEWIGKYTEQGNDELKSVDNITMTAVSRAKAKLALAQEIDASNPAVTDLADRIEAVESDLTVRVKSLYDSAKQDVEAGEWVKAYFTLQQIQTLFPNYEDSFHLLTFAADNGSQALFEKGKALFDKDDFMGASEYLNQAVSLKSDHEEAQKYLSLLGDRNNKIYFIQKGRNAANKQEWDNAVMAYERALEYDSGDQSLRDLIDQVRTMAVDQYLRASREQLAGGWLLKAFNNFELAQKYSRTPEPVELGRLRQDLCAQAAYLASTLKDQNRAGSAWFWYSKIRDIDPQYAGIFYLAQEMEDIIQQRVKKSIAVFDFSSPSDNTDAGIIVANNLITYLFKNASGDIKILERENLKSILEEMKLGQIGVVSSNSAKEMGRVYGIDVAIMGSVLLFKVDSSSSEGTKTVRYQIGTKIEDNIEYLNWKARHPNASGELLAQAPPAKIQIPEHAEKDYTVSTHKKIGFMQLSFRIVDVATGENIQVKTVERKIVAEDDASAGLKEANVEYDPLEIPTDTELLQRMTDEVVAELGREALRPLQNLEQIYFQDGENYLRRRDLLSAAERFVDTLFDEKLKRIEDSPVTQKAKENLANIFLDYQLVMGAGS